MWETIQISVGQATYRARFKMQGPQLILEWAGGRVADYCGHLKPELVAAMRLKKLVTRPVAA